MSATSAIAGFELPSETREQFLAVHRALTREPLSPFLQRLTARQDWLRPFSDSVLGHVQEGIAASHYHLGNVERIERELLRAAADVVRGSQVDAPTTIAGGNTRKLNFEYQAFAFALRRSLEYFAVSVGMLFKTKVHRIRGLEGAIKSCDPADVRGVVQATLRRGLPTVADLLPDREVQRSVRDRLAHWEAVDAGTLNVALSADEIRVFLAGGGEQLRPFGEDGKPMQRRIVEVLQDQIRRVERVIFDVYRAAGVMEEL